MSRRDRRREEKLAKKKTRESSAPFLHQKDTAAVQSALASGIQHHQGGRIADAAVCYKQVLKIEPNHPVALHLLGVTAHLLGKSTDAVNLIEKSLANKPDDAGAHNNLGNVYRDLKQLDAALACYQTALRLAPNHADAHNNLGNMYRDQGMLDEAIACYRKALKLNPGQAETHNNLGSVLEGVGRLDEARDNYRAALSLNPNYTRAHSNLLLSSHYHPGVSLADLKALHLEWDQRHGAPLRAEWREHANTRDADRVLRVGFVSPDLGQHPVGYFIVSLLKHRAEGAGITYVCYSDRAPDPLTERLMDLSDEWVDSRPLSDQDLCERIRADRIDILIDLAGHTAKNRLPVFARKPAPVQVAWAGYVGTTGLTGMDYLIADSRHIPEGTEHHFTEKVVRLPAGWLCYEPPDFAPSVASLPAEKNGYVTFGSFNSPTKINDSVIDTWAAVLDKVPRSRLLLRYMGMDAKENRARILERFAARGIDTSRVLLKGRATHAEILAAYNDIDIALDTFPYSGGLTTCEALWMGVPVITLPGETFASRHSLSHLTSVGATELVAGDRQAYVEKAAALAGDQSRLANYKSGLREKMRQSPLCEAEKFSADFTAVLRRLWNEFCTSPA